MEATNLSIGLWGAISHVQFRVWSALLVAGSRQIRTKCIAFVKFARIQGICIILCSNPTLIQEMDMLCCLQLLLFTANALSIRFQSFVKTPINQRGARCVMILGPSKAAKAPNCMETPRVDPVPSKD